MTSFIVAGGMGAVVSQYLHSTAASLSLDKMLTELGMVVQPFNGLGMLLPALFGFFGGTLLLLVWNFFKTRMVRYLLECNMWFLKPKHPINQLWYILMIGLLGKKQRGAGKYQEYLPSLPVPALKRTCKKYLKSVRPLLSDEEYRETEAAVKEFQQKDGKKLQWFLKFRSWRMRNWMAKWWIDFIYLRQRTSIAFNSNYYAGDHGEVLTQHGVDRAATLLHHILKFGTNFNQGKIENAMGGKLAPFCAASYKYLFSTTRVPGKEIDKIEHYGTSKPKHVVVYRQGKYYMIEGCNTSGRVHPPKVLKKQLEQVIQMAGEESDETGVAAFTALPRAEWAEIRERLEQNETNKRSLRLIDSSLTMLVLDSSKVDKKQITEYARMLFHGDGYNRWFDKSVQIIVTDSAYVGANVEHSSLDATVCGQMWEYILSEEKYDENGFVLQYGETPKSVSTPTVLRWELDSVKEELEAAKINLTNMIKDSDLCCVTPSYSKGFPKKCRLSPDGWFQMALQLAFYRLHHKFVLTYESATTRLYYEGRTETIRPVSEDSVAFVKSFDDPTVPRDEVKKKLSQAISDQCNYKMEAMRGLGVDRHLFGLYIVAKGMNLDPMPKMFSDKAFNLSFELSTSQTPVKTTDRFVQGRCAQIGGFGTATDTGYGVSYLVLSDDDINFSVHSKRSQPETDSKIFCEAICKAFDDMRALFED